MGKASIEEMTDAFVESLATEKGYSDHTGRAYRRDLESFFNFIRESMTPDASDESPPIRLTIDDITGLVIRGSH